MSTKKELLHRQTSLPRYRMLMTPCCLSAATSSTTPMRVMGVLPTAHPPGVWDTGTPPIVNQLAPR